MYKIRLMDGVQMKKKQALPKTVPWEPYKGATSPHTRGTTPVALPPLIPYRISPPSKAKGSKEDFVLTVKESVSSTLDNQNRETSNNVTCNGNAAGIMVDRSKEISIEDTSCASNESNKELEQLRQELEAERKVTEELRKLLVASMGDDLTCQIQALSEDKVRLASKMDSFAAQSSIDHDRAEDLEIMSDMWRCKFLAMSVRADELTSQHNRLLNHLRKEHQVLGELVNALKSLPVKSFPRNLLSSAQSLLSVDISSFCERTPCDEKFNKPVPVTSNITISCCKNCATHEIKLL